MARETFVRVCKLDGKKFIGEYSGDDTKKLISHLKNQYNMSYQEYILKVDYNGKIPDCACGCGEKTKYYKGIYRKYHLDHKNKMSPSLETLEKIKIKTKYNNAVEIRIKKTGISKEVFLELYEKYIGFAIDADYIKKTTALDFRTVKKYWFDLKFVENKEIFRRITKRHQIIWSNKNDKSGGKKHIDDNLLLDLFFYLKNNKLKSTLKEVIRKYDIKETQLVLYKRLSEKFGEKEIDELLKSGVSSKMEIEYFNILKFFFDKNITKQFKLEKKFYDYKLGDNILIEFDGNYWHSLDKNKKNDKEKDQIAIKNGYKIFRVKENEYKNIDILAQIKSLFENENQTKRSSKEKSNK